MSLPEKDRTYETRRGMNNFSVELVGLPADHFTYQGGAFVITNEIFKQAVQILKDAYIEQNGSFTSFSDIIQSTLKEMGVTVDDLTQDMAATFIVSSPRGPAATNI